MGATAIADEIQELQEWMESDRFKDTVRVYPARLVADQKGTVPQDYTIARDAAEQFYARLRELFAEGKSITSFGPYSPGQAVQMKRSGIEGIYLGGWATSAKGSTNEDPGPDLASYPLSQVPDEAEGLVRALLTADKNQRFLRVPHDRGAARRDPRGRFPPVHHRRRRHRSRRRRPRAQPRPALRRGRRPRLSHRGPEARREEVRTPGRQGPRPVGRADQAPQRRALPARHHAGAAASSSRAPTPSRPTSSTRAATSAISPSSSASPTSPCPATSRPSSPSSRA